MTATLAYDSTLVEDTPRPTLDLPPYAGGLRGVAVMDEVCDPLPTVVRQRGVVESVTDHVISVRCEDGFAQAYVLIDDFGVDGGQGGGADLTDLPTFDHLRPGDEVMVTSWLEHDQPD